MKNIECFVHELQVKCQRQIYNYTCILNFDVGLKLKIINHATLNF